MCSAALLAFDVLSYAYRRIGVNVDWMAVILLAALIAALAQVEESWGVDAAGETGPGCGTGPDSPVLAAAYRLARDPRGQRVAGHRDHRRDRPEQAAVLVKDDGPAWSGRGRVRTRFAARQPATATSFELAWGALPTTIEPTGCHKQCIGP